MDQQGLLAVIKATERKYDGTFHVAVTDLRGGESFELRAHQPRPTASAFKLCVLCELFRQSREEGLDLNAPIACHRAFLRPGDGVLRVMRPGQTLTAYNLAVLMMIVSDNTATAELVNLVGADRVTRTMQSLGLKDTDIHQGLPGGAWAARMRQPVSSAYDLCRLMTLIYRHELLTPRDCKDILRIMRANRMNDMLPRYIPVGEDWGDAQEWIANKIGYGDCRVDVGVVHARNIIYATGLFFKPRRAPRARFKCLADYPPILAMAEVSLAIFQSI